MLRPATTASFPRATSRPPVIFTRADAGVPSPRIAGARVSGRAGWGIKRLGEVARVAPSLARTLHLRRLQRDSVVPGEGRNGCSPLG